MILFLGGAEARTCCSSFDPEEEEEVPSECKAPEGSSFELESKL